MTFGLVIFAGTLASALEIIVVPDGGATGDGVFTSLEAARDALRDLKANDGLPDGGRECTAQTVVKSY